MVVLQLESGDWNGFSTRSTFLVKAAGVVTNAFAWVLRLVNSEKFCGTLARSSSPRFRQAAPALRGFMFGGSKLTFYRINRSMFSRLCKLAGARGLNIWRPSGETEKDGVIIQWNYDASNETLEVECVHAPFWFNPVRITDQLGSEIEATLRSNRAA